LLPTSPGSFLLELTPVYEYLKARGSKVEGERILVGDWLVQFFSANGPLEREALDEAVHTEVEGVPTLGCSAENLVAFALRAGRAKDSARIMQFLEQDVVDHGKLNRILTRHGLLPNWEKFERRYLEEG